MYGACTEFALKSWTAKRNQDKINRVKVYILPDNISDYVLLSSLFQFCILVVGFFHKKKRKNEERRIIELP